MPNQKIAIIGAGIAGLAAGCYAQMNGYDSEIYELHDLPGGLCTSWKRGEYIFDGCIDWMTGSAPDGMFYPIWQELGAVQKNRFLYHQEYCRYVDTDGNTLTFHLDMDKLETELLSRSPRDSKAIRELCGTIRSFNGFRPNVAKAVETMGLADYLKMMPDMMMHSSAYRNFFKYGKVSMAQLAERFRDPLIREMILSIWDETMPVSLLAATMAWCGGRTAGYPEGGSLKVARDIERRYLDLGGRIHYKQRVRRIIVKDGRAAGLELDGGGTVEAGVVISAADGHETLYHMLGGEYGSDEMRNWYNNAPTFPPYIQVSLGVNLNLQGLPRLSCVRMTKPVTFGNKTQRNMVVHNYAFDPTLAPQGKTPVVVRFFTDYDYWQDHYGNRAQYREKKNELARVVIAELERLYPGITSHVETIDVATPLTYVRYTGTWRGATMSWLPTTANFSKSLPKTLPGPDGFYLCGQWLVPGGGLPNAVKTARDALQILCKRDGKKFVTTTPVYSVPTEGSQ